jgi:lysophospholipase L1-like esterase
MTSANESKRLGSRASALGLLLAVAFFVLCCSETATDPTGGETHFLTVCDERGAACGAGLACFCGVCTLPCSAESSCDAYSSAQCLPCGSSKEQGYCDATCESDADCSTISPQHRCEQGRCRAPSLAAGGSSGASAGGGPSEAGSGSAAGEAAVCQVGETAAEQVLLLGDSFFASGMQQVAASLEALASSAGALVEGAHYRDSSALTQNAFVVDGGGLAAQYTAAAEAAAVEVVIMNGGGADAIVDTCDVNSPECPLLADVDAAARSLFARMAADGVQHVIYAYYPDAFEPTLRDKIDALRPLLQEACAASPVVCHWLDLRPIFAGHYAEYLQSDGLNPNAVGADATALSIWSVMQSNCVAQ